MSVGVIIPAAGMGKRMGTAEKKQFLHFQNKPVFIHTLQVFEEQQQVEEIVVVAHEADVARKQEYVSCYEVKKVKCVVAGGKERQDSVYLGLQQIAAEWVLVHDAVRPFVKAKQIEALLAEVVQYEAAILAVPMKETVKRVDKAGMVVETPDRQSLWSVQTPQAFRRDLLVSAHERVRGEELLVTDDAMLVEALGVDVRVVHGDYTNIKLTTPDDLAVATAIWEGRKKS
ncbi:2-C-methyl-D-erythritol 4-phosphate cytidylyltransferase [Mechercharimyces sp. CAU 1602]|uniref:2-C-methyl-D-erythritol 4-phosphate cytidylyltransferase n=1 Tax=Mechercharimyces sp. CAU 1602 TaxID=2973933 RepID=UPI002867DF4A|nr:2-C-methyl-D-erythritol 4-phosphate cytidylyltransferase [Mechercharimyces sp. CAU 1602]